MDEQNFLLKQKEDSLTDSNTDNSHSLVPPKQELKTFLTKLEDIDLPTVLVKDLDSYENKGWQEKTANLSDYFNYGYNEDSWKKYSEKILTKLNDLKKAIEENSISLTQKDLTKYLFNMPADFGGLGELLDERKYENLNFFEYKPSKNKTIPTIEVKQGSICVPLERNENLIINYNPPTNVNNFSSINTNITPGSTTFPYPHQTLPPNFNLTAPVNPFFNPHFVRPPGMEMHMPYPHFYMPRPMDYDRAFSIANISHDRKKSREEDSVSIQKPDKKKKEKKRRRSRSRSRSKKRTKHSRSRSNRKRSRSRSKDRSRKDKKRY